MRVGDHHYDNDQDKYLHEFKESAREGEEEVYHQEIVIPLADGYAHHSKEELKKPATQKQAKSALATKKTTEEEKEPKKKEERAPA